MYVFEYTLDETDYMELNKYHLDNASENEDKRPPIPKFYVLLAVVFSAFIIFGIVRPGTVPGSMMFMSVACLGLMFLMFMFHKQIISFLVKGRIKTMKKKGRLPFGQNVRIQFDDENIHERTEIGETTVKSRNIEKVANASHGIYIYVGAMQAFIIPHRAFTSEQQKVEFLSFVSEKASDNRGGHE